LRSRPTKDDAEPGPETVMRKLRLYSPLTRGAFPLIAVLEGRMQIKRTASRFQARIHAAESIENAAEILPPGRRCNEGAIGAREERDRGGENRRNQNSKCSDFRGRKT